MVPELIMIVMMIDNLNIICGRRGRDRTYDRHRVKMLRYRCATRPLFSFHIVRPFAFSIPVFTVVEGTPKTLPP